MFEATYQNEGTSIGHRVTHRYVRGSPMVPGEQLSAGTHLRFNLSANKPPEQSNSHLSVFGSAYKSGVVGHFFTHYHVVLSDHSATSLSHKDRQKLVVLSA